MRLMIIGDLGGQFAQASRISMAKGAKVYQVSDIDSALYSLRSGKGADLIMIDIAHNIKLLCESLMSERICMPVVACGINCSAEKAAGAIKAGAIEYLPLPLQEELITTIFSSISQSRDQPIVYNSESFAKVLEVARRVAMSDATVLITGASGTGKELIARFIHKNSSRQGEGFVAVNCAAIPDNLLESELFGHEKGAFTGAIEKRVGKFEEANNGTLLLDEVSEMDLRLQAKLLRVLQEKEIVRVGGSKVIKLNIRVLATSNRDLSLEVRKGNFREDLLYRLNVIYLELPSLRERAEDVKLLAEHFIAKYCKIDGLPIKGLASAALEKLKSHAWPGNIRELENVMHRAVLLSVSPEIQQADIAIMPTYSVASGLETLENIERNAIKRVIELYGRDFNSSAAILGISIATLKKKLAQHNIDQAD